MKPRAETLRFARYVILFTTFPTELYSATEVLEWYRLRWQVELVFKRFKSLAQLGHLPKFDDESAKAWLYGKLLVALLTEKIVRHARTLSPWGYSVQAYAQHMEGIQVRPKPSRTRGLNRGYSVAEMIQQWPTISRLLAAPPRTRTNQVERYFPSTKTS